MNRVIPKFPEALRKREPGLRGVIPPMIRIQARNHRTNIPRNEDGFFKDAAEFIKKFGPKGPYHNLPHLQEVGERFLKVLEDLKDIYPKVFKKESFLAAKIASLCHDIVHNEYGFRDPIFELNVKDICKLYGFEDDNVSMRKLIMDAMNIGIQEDIDLSGVDRELISDVESPIKLSDEEISMIVLDALAYRNGLDFKLRCQLPGMLHATEFRRAMEDGKPAFKWAQTPMELLMILSDIGNYILAIPEWLKRSVEVNIELPLFEGKTATEFIKAQLEFLDNYGIPGLDPKNCPLIPDQQGKLTNSWVPDYFRVGLDDKVQYLKRLLDEIENILHCRKEGIEVPESDELKSFKEAIRPALQKSNLSLANPDNPVPLDPSDMQAVSLTKFGRSTGKSLAG